MPTVVNEQTQTIWVRTRSGATITMVLPGARFTFEKNWKRFDVNKTQYTWIERQKRLLEITNSDPTAIASNEPKLVYQGFELSSENLELTIGDNINVEIKYLPEGVDVSKLNPTITSDNPKIASAQIVSRYLVAISARNTGVTTINVIVGSSIKTISVSVNGLPFFQSQEYKGTVGETIALDVVNAEEVDLTLPENVSVVEGNSVKANKPGTYEILASANGRTFTTKLVVSDSTETTTD